MTLLTKQMLGGASAAADKLCEEKGFPEALKELGVDPGSANYVAVQRAARAYAVMNGKLRQFLEGEPLSIPREVEVLLMATWMDGLASGLMASKQVTPDGR